MATNDLLKGRVVFIAGAALSGMRQAVRPATFGGDITAVNLCEQIGTVPQALATVKPVEDTAARIATAGGDVQDRTWLSAALQKGLDEFGYLDIVVANGPTEATDGRLDHLRGSASAFATSPTSCQPGRFGVAGRGAHRRPLQEEHALPR